MVNHSGWLSEECEKKKGKMFFQQRRKNAYLYFPTELLLLWAYYGDSEFYTVLLLPCIKLTASSIFFLYWYLWSS